MNADIILTRCRNLETVENKYLEQYFDYFGSNINLPPNCVRPLYDRRGGFVTQGLVTSANKRCCLIRAFIDDVKQKRTLKDFNGVYETLCHEYKTKSNGELREIIISSTTKQNECLRLLKKNDRCKFIPMLNKIALMNKRRCSAINVLRERRNVMARSVHLAAIERVVVMLSI